MALATTTNTLLHMDGGAPASISFFLRWTPPPKTIAMVAVAVINAFCLGAAVSIRSDSGNRPRDDRDGLIRGEGHSEK